MQEPCRLIHITLVLFYAFLCYYLIVKLKKVIYNLRNIVCIYLLYHYYYHAPIFLFTWVGQVDIVVSFVFMNLFERCVGFCSFLAITGIICGIGYPQLPCHPIPWVVRSLLYINNIVCTFGFQKAYHSIQKGNLIRILK